MSSSYWPLSDTCQMCSRSVLPVVPPAAAEASPPPPAPPSMALITASWSASGSVSDYDATTLEAVKALLAIEAAVSPSDVSLEVTAGSAIFSASITVLAEAAEGTVAAWNAGMFASPEALETALSAGGAGSVSVEAILSVPAYAALAPTEEPAGDSSDSSEEVVMMAAMSAVVTVACFCICFCYCRYGARDLAGAPPPPPPPPVAGDRARKSQRRSTYAKMGKEQEMMPPPPPPPPPPLNEPLPAGWTEQYDDASGHAYFYNLNTGEALWERPASSTFGAPAL